MAAPKETTKLHFSQVTGGVAAAKYAQLRETLSRPARRLRPRTGRFSPTGNMTTPRDKFAAALLPDGKVFVVGGQADSPFGHGLSTTEIYGPASGKFSLGPSMQFRRFKLAHGVVALRNGEILVAGGASRPEFYDPGSNSFQLTTRTLLDRFYFSTVTLLPCGEALLAGGYGAHDTGGAPNHAWLYEP